MPLSMPVVRGKGVARRADPGSTILGIDEAGRGSLLGPLVVGGFLTLDTPAVMRRLRNLGVRDSKTLSPGIRERILPGLTDIGEPLVEIADPAEVDRAVSKGRLNQLELELMHRLCRRANPGRVQVDACDVDVERFRRALEQKNREVGCRADVYARHKADHHWVVVSAASIVAKVHRDRALQGLKARLREDVGSGYPSDPRTRDYLRRLLERSRSLPSHVRGSWATVVRVRREIETTPLESFDGNDPSEIL